jgi:replicative DNA helicase/pimeloyl-ACP methyl ester carboxylesterase
LSEELTTAEALTLRTGFFSARATAVVQDALEGLLGRGGELLAVVGGDLLQCDVAALRVLLNLRGRYPEQTAIFVITEPAFQNAKTYHLQHRDGRSSAWVGSANFTVGGFATNLEAAMVLDSKDDDPAVIDQVRAATVATAGQPAAIALDQAVLHQLEQRVREARLGPPGTRPARPSPLIVDHCHLLLDRLDRSTTNPAPAGGGVLEVLPTGFHDLDNALAGGLRPGTLSVVASRPGAGRSTLVLNVLTQAAIVHRAAAALYSFEAPDDELVLRVVSATTRIRHLDLRHGRLDYTHWTTIADTLSRFADAPLYLDSHQPPHLDALCCTITAAVARDGVDLVAVDSPTLVLAGPRTDPHDSHVAEVLRRLKHLAMQLRIHIIVTAELERSPQPTGPYLGSRKQSAPQICDLRDRDAVMETADVVVLLHRPDTDERDHPRMGEADLLVVKNRYGVPATVTIAHQLHHARFATIGAAAPPAAPPPPTDPAPSPAPSPSMQDETEPPANGTSGDKEWLVAADDIEIMVRSTGAGHPPVIFLGRADPADDEWAALIEQLEGAARAVTYRRPRDGGPDPLSAPVADGRDHIRSAVIRLDRLLNAARISPPYVLVASSVGAWIADQYAARSPRNVAGMVLIDPVNLTPWPTLDTPPPAPDGDDGDTGWLRTPSEACYTELARPAVVRPRRTVVISSTDGRWQRHPPRTGDLTWDPATLAEIDRLWQGYQRDWVDRLNARHVVATDASHLVHRDQPDLVARIITDVVHATHASHGLRLDQGAIAARGGRIMPRQ